MSLNGNNQIGSQNLENKEDLQNVSGDIASINLTLTDITYNIGTDTTTISNNVNIPTGKNLIVNGVNLKNQVDSNQSNISTNSSDIATNSSDIATNSSDIATNSSNIATNTSNISTNTNNIATNTSNISTNTNNIAANSSNIAANTSNISTNTANISTNTSNISTNTSNISTNTNNISTNTNNISTNTTKLTNINYTNGDTIISGDVKFTNTDIVVSSGIQNLNIGSGLYGLQNLRIGENCLLNPVTPSCKNNIAIGFDTLRRITTSERNTICGVAAGTQITSSTNNTGFGLYTLSNFNGTEHQHGLNTAIGSEAGRDFINGRRNTFLGAETDFDVSNGGYQQSTAVGFGALITGSNQIKLGTIYQDTIIDGENLLVGGMNIKTQINTNISDISNNDSRITNNDSRITDLETHELNHFHKFDPIIYEEVPNTSEIYKIVLDNPNSTHQIVLEADDVEVQGAFHSTGIINTSSQYNLKGKPLFTRPSAVLYLQNEYTTNSQSPIHIRNYYNSSQYTTSIFSSFLSVNGRQSKFETDIIIANQEVIVDGMDIRTTINNNYSTLSNQINNIRQTEFLRVKRNTSLSSQKYYTTEKTDSIYTFQSPYTTIRTDLLGKSVSEEVFGADDDPLLTGSHAPARIQVFIKKEVNKTGTEHPYSKMVGQISGLHTRSLQTGRVMVGTMYEIGSIYYDSAYNLFEYRSYPVAESLPTTHPITGQIVSGGGPSNGLTLLCYYMSFLTARHQNNVTDIENDGHLDITINHR